MLISIEFRPRRLIWLGTGIAHSDQDGHRRLIALVTIKTFDRCLGRVPESRSSALLSTPRVTATRVRDSRWVMSLCLRAELKILVGPVRSGVCSTMSGLVLDGGLFENRGPVAMP